jgi:5-methyltetrahydrofolate--homocysteine methyltransferase
MKNFKENFFKFDFDELLPFLNFKRMERKYFGINKDKKDQFKEKFDFFIKKIKEEKLISVLGLYRFLKAVAKGDSIILKFKRKIYELKFPRQKGGEGLCLADFLRDDDFIVFFVLTSGIGVKKRAEKLSEDGDFLFAHFLEILSIEAAEAGAEVLNKKLGGKRFSFGYQVCPDLSYQKILFEILKPERIGINLTENYIMEPEASVSGFIINNPKAKYFQLEEE